MRFAITSTCIRFMLAIWLLLLLALIVSPALGGMRRAPSSMLAWVSGRNGNQEIYMLDMTYGDLANVSRHPGRDSTPAWSSDGRLAWAGWHEGNYEIYVLDLESRQIVNLSHQSCSDHAPTWTGEGRLAWVSDPCHREIFPHNGHDTR